MTLSHCPSNIHTEINTEREHMFESSKCDNSSPQYRLIYMLGRPTEPVVPQSM